MTKIHTCNLVIMKSCRDFKRLSFKVIEFQVLQVILHLSCIKVSSAHLLKLVLTPGAVNEGEMPLVERVFLGSLIIIYVGQLMLSK